VKEQLKPVFKLIIFLLKTSAVNAGVPHEFFDTAIFRLSQVLQAKQHWSFFFASQTKI